MAERERHTSGSSRRSRSRASGSDVHEPHPSWLTDHDIYLFNEGTHYRLFDKLGAHLLEDGSAGVHFGAWAPNAREVSVVGDFNGWQPGMHMLEPRAESGVWQGTVPDIAEGARYKYHIVSHHRGYEVDKADPYGFFHEMPPRTASIIKPLDYEWHDAAWMKSRGERHRLSAPISVYELHLGSWRRAPEEANRPLTYRELAPLLIAHIHECGFTHVEFMPVMEHPFAGSWGYQLTGYFAPTSRFGTPQDFMWLIDQLHQAGIGIILDWVPSHFPTDEHGLIYFDGTHLYEHEDPRQGFHQDWKSAIFNYGRNEVRAFLISNALFWLEKYHIDGLRVDAVASMLYLDYSRKEGEWIPNRYGGRENIEAIEFLRQLNTEVYRAFPDVQMIAEESTAWPMVSRPTYVGGLGFGLKWDMGWMHDTLRYLEREPIHRTYHHGEITFRALYQFTENYMLPLSHDEVVHGKGSLLRKMPGDDWQRFANLRLLLFNQWTQPGKKLLFMGGEIGQWMEWNHESSLDWHLLEGGDEDGNSARHRGILRFVRELNRIYREEPALHEWDCDSRGFQWINANDAEQSVLSFLRRSDGGVGGSDEATERRSDGGVGGSDEATERRSDGGVGVEPHRGAGHEMPAPPAGVLSPAHSSLRGSVASSLRRSSHHVLVLLNFTPEPRHNYRVGVPAGGRWDEILNSDGREFGGSGQGNLGGVDAAPVPAHGHPWSLTLTVPPLAGVILRPGR